MNASILTWFSATSIYVYAILFGIVHRVYQFVLTSEDTKVLYDISNSSSIIYVFEVFLKTQKLHL